MIEPFALVDNINMNENELIKLWKSGLNKYQVAEVYRREYNQQIKIIRRDMRHRHQNFMTRKEALEYVEKILWKEVKK